MTDSMAAQAMKNLNINGIFVGADRIAANGDTANKIGTYSLAVLAKYHKIPFYVAAPLSTVDYDTLSGINIPVEKRSVKEITRIKNIVDFSSYFRTTNSQMTLKELQECSDEAKIFIILKDIK